jgi:Na+/proline symporter
VDRPVWNSISARSTSFFSLFTLAFVLGIGFALKRAVTSSLDFFLSGRSLPAWVTGLGYISANIGAVSCSACRPAARSTAPPWCTTSGLRPGRPDRYYLVVGRWVTVAGVGIAILTAFIASGFSNITNYLQTLFSFFNVPLFCAFIIGMFWKRAGRGAGFWGILVGTTVSVTVYALYKWEVLSFRSDLQETMWGSVAAFVAGAIAMVVASSREEQLSDQELHGLVYGQEIHDASDAVAYPWYRSPVVMGGGVLLLSLLMYIVVESL